MLRAGRRGPGGTRGAAFRRWQGPRRGEEGDVCSGASQGPLSTGEAGPSSSRSRSPRARLPLGGAEDGRVRSRLEPAPPVGGEAAAGCAGAPRPLSWMAGAWLGTDLRRPWTPAPVLVPNEAACPPRTCRGFRVLICEIITSQGCKDQMRLDV